MSVKHTWTTSIKNDSGAAVVTDNPVVIIGPSEVNFSVAVAPLTTVEVDDCPVTVADIASGFVTTDKAVAIKTNSSTTPSQTINLQDKATGNVNTLSYNDQMPVSVTNPFTTNVTKWYIVNSSSTNTANVRGGFILSA
jgi:hypothetical protein